MTALHKASASGLTEHTEQRTSRRRTTMHTKSARLSIGGLLGVLALACAATPPAAATYEGNNGRIAFGAFFDSNRQADIWSTKPGEDDLHQLTNAPGHDICPAYSADGKQIAFCSDRTGAYEIWVMDANGKQERQVTQLETYAVFPDFSPDSSWLAFSAESAGESTTDLWLVPTAGGAPTQLTHTPDTLEENPVWSPDGTTILFVRIAGDFSGGQLWTMDVASGQQTQLTFDPTFKDQTPDWSPDGTRIAYAADDDIWIMDANGTDQVNLTNSPNVEFGTAFSPDGTHIAFTGTGGPVPAGQRYVQTIRTDGSDRRIVAPTPGLRQAAPGWQPLGSGR
jgi:Tol biopolymer transport system component